MKAISRKDLPQMLFEFTSQLQIAGRLCRRIGEVAVIFRSSFFQLFVWNPAWIKDHVIYALTAKSLPCQLSSQFMSKLRNGIRMLACSRFRRRLNLAVIRTASLRQRAQRCGR